MKTLEEKENCRFLGILKTDPNQAEMNEKNKENVRQMNEETLKIRPYSRNLINGINTWTVFLLR